MSATNNKKATQLPNGGVNSTNSTPGPAAPQTPNGTMGGGVQGPPSQSTSPPAANNAPKYGTLVPNRVFVGGISANTTEGELAQLFSAYGTVKATKIISDRAGVSKGYGFVTFESEEEAKRLQRESDNIMLRERRLNIAPAIKKQPFNKSFDMASPPPANSVNQAQFYYAQGVPYAAYQNAMAYYASTPQQTNGTDPQPTVYQTPSVYAPTAAAPAPPFPMPMYPPQPLFIQQQYPYQPIHYDPQQYFGSNVGPAQYMYSNPGPGGCSASINGRTGGSDQQSATTKQPSLAPPAAYYTTNADAGVYYNYNNTVDPGAVAAAAAIYNSEAALAVEQPPLVVSEQLIVTRTQAAVPFFHSSHQLLKNNTPTTAPPSGGPPPPPTVTPPYHYDRTTVPPSSSSSSTKSSTSSLSSHLHHLSSTPVVSLLSVGQGNERDFESMQGGRKVKDLVVAPAAPVLLNNNTRTNTFKCDMSQCRSWSRKRRHYNSTDTSSRSSVRTSSNSSAQFDENLNEKYHHHDSSPHHPPTPMFQQPQYYQHGYAPCNNHFTHNNQRRHRRGNNNHYHRRNHQQSTAHHNNNTAVVPIAATPQQIGAGDAPITSNDTTVDLCKKIDAIKL